MLCEFANVFASLLILLKMMVPILNGAYRRLGIEEISS